MRDNASINRNHELSGKLVIEEVLMSIVRDFNFKPLLIQIDGLSELIPNPLSNSIRDFRKYVTLAKRNITVGPSQIVPGQTGYLAARDICRGEEVFALFGTLIGYQTPQHSVQIGYGIHIDPHKYGGRYVNHHCEGNLIIKWDSRGLHHFIASRDIKIGEEISYSYWRTELEWNQSASENEVRCSCGSRKCIGKILSFRQLSRLEKEIAFAQGGIAWYLFHEYEKFAPQTT